MRVGAAELRALARRDPRLGAALRRVPPLPDFPREGLPSRLTRYEALARAIVHQQLSGKAAATIWRRSCALSPRRRFPRPPELLSLPEEALRAAGLSAGKQRALRDLAARVEDGRLSLRSIGHREDEAVIEELVAVRGIGRWTAQMFLLFQLGRPDVMAPDDLGLQEGLRILDGLEERPGPRELAARAEAWAPLRSVASWTLWRLVDTAAQEL
jgi:DNA-3-methyladenine glycosylase II